MANMNHVHIYDHCAQSDSMAEEDRQSLETETELIQVPPVTCRNRVRFNIGGQRFTTYHSTLQRIPGTYFANLTHNNPAWDEEEQEYFFDRNARMFPYLLDGLRLGMVHFPHCHCTPSVKEELHFWGISENIVAQCCWRQYKEYEDQQKALENLDAHIRRTANLIRQTSQPNMSCWERWKANTLLFLEEPTSSMGAKLWSVVYTLLLVTSLLLLVLGTVHSFRVLKYDNSTLPEEYHGMTDDEKKGNMTKIHYIANTVEHPTIKFTTHVLIFIFLLELILRFVVWPKKNAFLFDFFNFVDTASIVPLAMVATIEIIRPSYWVNNEMMVITMVVTIANVFRTFRIFKVMNHNQGLRVLMLALYASAREILLLLLLVGIGVVVFSTTIYYAELDRADEFEDITHGFWWSIITMTTVGYGDVYPTTGAGRIVGACCAVSGMLIMGLPIPIIASNFNLYYSYSKLNRHTSERKKNTVQVGASIRRKLRSHKETFLLKFQGSTKETKRTEAKTGDNDVHEVSI